MKYKVIISGAQDDVTIDEDEIPKVVEAAKGNDLVAVKHGVINTSFFVGIVRDRKAEAKESLYIENDEPTPFEQLDGDKTMAIASPDNE